MGGHQSTLAGSPGSTSRLNFTPQDVSNRIGSAANAVGQMAGAAGAANNAFQMAMTNLAMTNKVVGGCDCEGGAVGYFGGAEDSDPAKDLRQYENSLSSQAKLDTIRRLATALSRAGIDVDPNADPDEIVKRMVAQIPNPRQGGKTFAANAKAQEKVCQIIARVLNDAFTPGVTRPHEMFIDTSLNAASVCGAVSEWGHSLASGVNTEFLAVHASVRNALRSISTLSEIMRELHGKMTAKVERAGDAALAREVDPLAEAYARAEAERLRQQKLLENILHIQLAPAERELALAMSAQSDLHAMVKRLGLTPGTAEFGDSLAAAISGLGSAAAIAQRINKALKQVGASVREYLDSPGFGEFQRMADAKMYDVPAKDLAQFLEAVAVLRGSFKDREEPRLREALERADGAYRVDDDGKVGGDDDENLSAIEKRIRRVGLEKKIIVRDFVTRMSKHYDEVLSAVRALGPEIGKSIPTSEKIESLRDALQRLRDMRPDRIEFALVGLYINADARERKERFINSLRLVSSVCTAVMELEMYRNASALFARLKAAIDSLEKTVDYFSDVVTKKFGGDADADGVIGGAEGDDMLPAISRQALSLNEAVSEFTYQYYIAKVRQNLARSSKELDAYGEGYAESLGDAVAIKLWKLRKERDEHLKKITARDPPYDGNPFTGHIIVNTATAGSIDIAQNGAPADKVLMEKNVNTLKAIVEGEYQTKEKFYKVLQAIDLYLKAFTAGIAKDPDAVRDFKGMLDKAEVIARWFNEETGNSLWKAFDSLGMSADANGRASAVAAAGTAAITRAVTNPQDHYYQLVGNQITDPNSVASYGIPQVSAPYHTENITKTKDHISTAIDNFQALKNLINAFTRIGDEFGGREVRSQVFMSPTQIFKGLTEFMKSSALSYYSRAAAADVSQYFNGDIDDIAGGVAIGGVHFSSNAYTSGGIATAAGKYTAECQYFKIIVKAMASKILTTLGMFDMLERRVPLERLTPVRMIVGGARGAQNDDPPEVVEGAAELYFRLPRLAEFYRSILLYNTEGANVSSLKIAMLPELEGVFSELIAIIFHKVANPESGDYSDGELHMLIREINLIYMHFRAKDAATAIQAALNGFVAEINRRYGIIKLDEMKKYNEMVKRTTATTPSGPAMPTNYSILPNEDESERAQRAPSDKFVVPPALAAAAADPSREFGQRIQLDDDVNALDSRRMLLRDMRKKLETELGKVQAPQYGKVSFSLRIKQAASRIRDADPAAKLVTAMELIQGSSTVGLEASKAYMFHETVVVGLNTLCAINELLDNYERAINHLDPKMLMAVIMNSIKAIGVRVANDGVDKAVIVSNITTANAVDGEYYGPFIHTGRSAIGHGAGIAFVADNNAEVQYFGRGGVANDVTSYSIYSSIYVAALGGGAFNAAPNTLPAAANTISFKAYLDGNTPTWTDAEQKSVRLLHFHARFLADYEYMMETLINTVNALHQDTNGLVEVRLSQGNADANAMQINFSKLQTVAENILSDVKFFFEELRPFIPQDTLSRFEDKDRVGSIFWIEQHLVDKRFRDVSETPASKASTLDGLSRKTSTAFANLIGTTGINGNPATIANATVVVGNVVLLTALEAAQNEASENRFEQYGKMLSGLVWYNSFKGGIDTILPPVIDIDLGANDTDPVTLVQNYRLERLIRTPGLDSTTSPVRYLCNANQPGGNANAHLHHARVPLAIYRSNSLHSSNDADIRVRSTDLNHPSSSIRNKPMHSILFDFNQLLANYLDLITDSSNKFYANLLIPYANGIAAEAIGTIAGKAYPDMTQARRGFDIRADPANGCVVLQSLAIIMQHLIRDANATTLVPLYQVSTMIDVPLYMKERLRAGLPGFIRLFDLLIQRCEFIKQLTQKTSIRCERPAHTAFDANAAVGAKVLDAGGAVVNTMNDTYFITNSGGALDSFTVALTSNQMRDKLVVILDGISAHAYTLTSCATEVLKELGDRPVYGELQENSIETYRARYGRTPIAPLSFLTRLFANETRDRGKLFPTAQLGTAEFKFQYGVRGIIARRGAAELESMPTVKALLDAYNGTTTARFDAARFASFVKNIVTAVRYIAETREYKPLIMTTSVFSEEPLINDAAANAPPNHSLVRWDSAANPPTGNTAYAVDKLDQELATLTESTNQDETLRIICDVVLEGDGKKNNSRATECVLNLIDMNIIPINVHALMRGIPLANLYNYEYNFEEMAAMVYGLRSRGILENQDIDNTRALFLRMLFDPYLSLNDGNVNVRRQLYGSDCYKEGSRGYIHRIMRGRNNLGLGRPKFLSSELFNKCCFGSLYQSADDFDEDGPAIRRPGDGNLARIVQHVDKIITSAEAMRTAFANQFIQIMQQTAFVNNGGAIIAAAQGDRLIDVAGTAFTDFGGGVCAIIGETVIAVLSNNGLADANAVADNVLLVKNDPRLTELVAAEVVVRGVIARQVNNDLIDTLLQNRNAVIAIITTIIARPAGGDPAALLAKIATIRSLYSRFAPLISTIQNSLNRLSQLCPAHAGGADPWLHINFIHAFTQGVAAGNNETIGEFVIALNRVLSQTFDAGYCATATGVVLRTLFNRNLNLTPYIVNGAGGLNGRKALAANGAPANAGTEPLIATDGFPFGHRSGLQHLRQLAIKLGQQNGIIANVSPMTLLTDRRSTHISFMSTAGAATSTSRVVEVGVQSVAIKQRLEEIGRMRFDTDLVRNMFFITNVLRVVRLKLNRELTHSRNVIVSSHAAVAAGVTEYGTDPFEPNAIEGSTQLDGQPRYADQDTR